MLIQKELRIALGIITKKKEAFIAKRGLLVYN